MDFQATGQKTNPADDRNRIELLCRCWLIEGNDRLVLVDTGIGEKLSEKERDRYSVQHDTGGLTGAIRRAGLSPQDVTDVVITHLHFDHAGGLTTLDHDGCPSLVFPQARHYLQAENWIRANSPTIRDSRSYIVDNFDVLSLESSFLELVDGNKTLFPGLAVRVVHGHTPGMQLPVVEVGERSIILTADLFPTASHVELVYTMAYDLQPLVVIEEKERILKEASAKNWLFAFGHAPHIEFAEIHRSGNRFVATPVMEVG